MRQEPSDAPVTPAQKREWADRPASKRVIDRTSSHDERFDRGEVDAEEQEQGERNGTQSRHIRR